MFGAMLTDANGRPFYLDGTLPLTLVDKQETTLSFSGINNVPLNVQNVTNRMVFVCTNGVEIGFYYAYDSVNSRWAVYFYGSPGQSVTIFTFGYRIQPKPSTWGFLIQDASGNIVLTHESKPLADITTLGTNGAESAGYNIDARLNGRWAVAPSVQGALVGVVQAGGQTRPFKADYNSSCFWDGSTTRIRSIPSDSGTGGLQNASYINCRNSMIAVNVSNY